MLQERRATFAKVLIENGEDAKTIYSFRLEKIHWVFAILASVAAIVVALVVLRGAVYASVQEVAGDTFRQQLDVFHKEAKPAIRKLIDEKIEDAATFYIAAADEKDHVVELNHAEALSGLAVVLGRMDERLGSIERRLNRMEPGR